MPDSERQLLSKLPGEVQSIDDMDKVKKDFEKGHKRMARAF